MYATKLNPSHIEILSHTEQCVVCGDAADGFHYGVRSCRGCNAFFRRAVTFNMSFTCRRGGRCPVDKNARCACRACRLAKCYAVGMDKKAVQPKREVHTSNGSFDQNDPDYDLRLGGTRTSPSYELSSDMTSPGSAFTPLNINLARFTPAIPPSPPSDSSLIVRQVYDFMEQKRRRRAMLCGSLEEILSEQEMTLRHPATSEDFTTIFQAQMVLMFEWVEKLPEFRMLCDHNDKTKLLRAFALKYMLLDNVYHTYELGFRDRLVLVNNNYIVPGVPINFKGSDVVDENQMRDIMFGEPMRALINELVLPIGSQNMLYGEIMTIRRIMFWNPGNVQLSEMAKALSAEACNVAMKELQQYLISEGVDDIEARIKFILLLLPSFTTHHKTMYEIVRLIPSFGKMSDWNQFMDDVLSGV
uniref:Nuclear receptor NHR-32 n=1 Tax=Caenorhabditis elegans TaxID=6239 RepID=Q86PK8_CAEEL|nr:nuclear receptor NHR-32 [Caenorhabditis elegans]